MSEKTAVGRLEWIGIRPEKRRRSRKSNRQRSILVAASLATITERAANGR